MSEILGMVKRVCPNCKEESILVLDKDKYKRWLNREANIQNIWPEMAPAEREQIT